MKTFIIAVCFILASSSMGIIFGQCIRINEPNLRNPRLTWAALIVLVLCVYIVVSILIPHW